MKPTRKGSEFGVWPESLLDWPTARSQGLENAVILFGRRSEISSVVTFMFSRRPFMKL